MMKISEVPQDKAFFEEGKIRDLCYVVDDKGHYTKALSLGWAPKNEAIKLAWDVVYEHAEETRKKILEGKLSPVAFYMELNIMNPVILANYMNLSRRKVKRHLKMKAFRKLKPHLIDRYAEVFGIDARDLTDIERLRQFKPADENQL
ncbi:MAG: hypothetical protein JXA61_00250 [Bacteroidales bacterium]|nr:hypothetical protein [Bacteroidales bacterium]